MLAANTWHQGIRGWPVGEGSPVAGATDWPRAMGLLDEPSMMTNRSTS
jgi:hypothetical protein